MTVPSELLTDRLKVLLDDLNDYRARTHYLSQIRAGKPFMASFGKRALPHLSAMDDWCVARGIDSRRWLYWLFHRTNFRFAPRIAYLIPNPKKEAEAIERFSTLRDTPYLAQRLHRDFAREKLHSGVGFDPNRDMSPMAENLKRRYLGMGEPERCMDQMFANSPDTHPTWGYHPKSVACHRCPLAQACMAKLRAAVHGFDPVALRSGTMTLEQAQIADGRWHHDRR